MSLGAFVTHVFRTYPLALSHPMGEGWGEGRFTFRAFASWRLCVKYSPVTQAEAKKRHAQLIEEIRRHDHAYYLEAKPTISDRDYDRLYHELLDLEKNFPDLATPDSPSQRVSGEPLKAFKPV